MSKFSIIIAILICFVFSANAQKPKSKPVSKPVVQTKVDLGKLRGNTYTNDFFELKFEFPLGWLVGDNVLEAQLKTIAQTQIKATNPNQQKSINQAVDRVTPLLGGYKALPGMPENANLRVMVEDLKTLPTIKNGKDYLGMMAATLKATKLPADYKYSEIKTETIDNLPLDYIETSTGNV